MKNLLFLLAFFSLCHPVFSQLTTDSISIKQKGSELQFIQNTRILKLKEVRSIMKSNEQAEELFSKAQLNYYTSYALQSIGAFVIGYSFGYVLTGNDLNYYALGSGAAAMLLSMPFVNAFQNHAESAVKIYNNDIDHNNSSTSLHFGFTSQGVGFTLLLK